MEEIVKNNIYNYLVNSRNVKEFLHFTPIDNLSSILKLGIIPRQELEDKGLEFKYNDTQRIDGKGIINLSITNPNINLFYKFRNNNPDTKFVVLSISPELLNTIEYKIDYCFSSTNAASFLAQQCTVEELFCGERYDLPENCTTDNQSEIILRRKIPVEFIECIYVSDEDSKRQVETICKKCKFSISVIISDSKYLYDRSLLIGKKNNNAPNKSPLNEYLCNWFTTKSAHKQLEKELRKEWSVSRFDVRAYHASRFKDPNFVDSLKPNGEWWRIKYKSVFDKDKIKRSNSELSALSVLEKIINRGKNTILCEDLENDIVKFDSKKIEKHIKLVHSFQVAVVELIKVQRLHNGNKIFVEDFIPYELTKLALKDLQKLDNIVSKLYGCKPLLSNIKIIKKSDKADLVFTISGTDDNCIRFEPEHETIKYRNFVKVQERVKVNADPKILSFLLEYIFRFNSFRPNQIDGIIRTLNYQDSIVLLPTGSGKSVIYQLASLITPGVSFIVDPLISLTNDQVDNLKIKGIDRVVALTSDVTSPLQKNEINEKIKRGQYWISFITPERFQNINFRNTIKYYSSTNIISLVAIDEAHCVSEWGHDFRPAYLRLAETSRIICRTLGSSPPILALTGTASATVLRDMKRDLNIFEEGSLIVPSSFDRQELNFRVISCSSNDRGNKLKSLLINTIPRYFRKDKEEFYKLNSENTNCGLVFCPFAAMKANSRGNYHPYGTMYAKNLVEDSLDIKCGLYNGKMQKANKNNNAKKFKNNEQSVMAVTKSYGMGIDKPNIRWSVHFSMPSSIEAFYQEAGRCGRDRERSLCYLILSDDHPESTFKILNDVSLSVSDVNTELEKLFRFDSFGGDDVKRLFFLHRSNYKAIGEEVDVAKDVITEIFSGQSIKFPPRKVEDDNEDDIKLLKEKILYRLSILGIVDDYTINHSKGYFEVNTNKFSAKDIEDNFLNYIRNYNSNINYVMRYKTKFKTETEMYLDSPIDFCVKAYQTLLIEFIHEIIEKGQRKSMARMLAIASKAAAISSPQKGGEELRRQVLAYLSADESAQLEEVIENSTDFEFLENLCAEISNSGKHEKTIGQINRLLESYPDNFGLYFVLLRVYSFTNQFSEIPDTLRNTLEIGHSNYDLSKQLLFDRVILPLFVDNLPASAVDSILDTVNDVLGKEYTKKMLFEIKDHDIERIYLIKAMHNFTSRVIKEVW